MSRRRAESRVPPALQERGLIERIAGIERERARAAGKARSEAFRQRERDAEARYLAEREAAEKGKAS